MKLIFIIFLIFFTNLVFANENQSNTVEVIKLHESKSLDQMVLENINEQGDEDIENTQEDFEEVVEDTDENKQNQTDEVEVKQIAAQNKALEIYKGIANKINHFPLR